ncbi:MAG: hypothetical protein ACE5KO_05075, partial [Candidatus Bathyarchaeia archaeon]
MSLTRILIIDHKSDYINQLVHHFESLQVSLDVSAPKSQTFAGSYDGIVLSGGALPQSAYRDVLSWYARQLDDLKIPLLGVCLGFKILGYCYGARIRKLESEESGLAVVKFHKPFPLAPDKGQLVVHEDHSFELIGIPEMLENYGSTDRCKIQAVKHKTKP